MKKREDISIVLCGPAGQGIKTAENLMVSIFRKSGYAVFATKEYMSRIRGGSNSTTIRISSRPVRALVDRTDLLIPLDREAFKHVQYRISPATKIIGEKETLFQQDAQWSDQILDVPLAELAKETGGKIYSNIIVVGIIAGLLKIKKTIVHSCVKEIFNAKEKEILDKNIQAVDRGMAFSSHLPSDFKIEMQTQKDNDIILNGGEAIGLGAVAGGCRFIASYPMTPSTPVLTFLSQHGETFDLIAEQAEDEIAAVNMALGAWYAGARSMVTTSGGGFALMTEGLSLAGMLETPIVIHLAQRPGPATGLPTRTEQGDLLFALHGGHGEFPRIIFTPGTLEDGFVLTQKAFDLADRFQIPVFILTDQYYIDSYYHIPKFDLLKIKNKDYIVKTDAKYKRYALTENGISPRGIPGYGNGLVVVDSDEHTEEGHITEDLDLRVSMVNKRLKKMDALIKEAVLPDWIGPKSCETLVICWGSTAHIVAEAIEKLKDKKIALLYFKQVYPLPSKTMNLIKKSKKLIIVENNATAQFAQILKSQLGIDIPTRILKYSGQAFSVEELEQRLKKAAL
ncbi:2-oxoacid:acceptor oxidoreductase subunit alpha [bacterium]|nr:2-oxoacid:acceptor oxidoreductase subunit alpha [bacterium]